MAALDDLQRAIFPAARPVGAGRSGLDPARAGREVAWVRVLKARVPAFDALDPDDLAIIPGPALAVVAPGPAQLDELAAALARSRVPAVLLVEGESGGEALDALATAAAAAGLTVLRLGRTDPVALERSVIGFLVNRRAELDRRAAELEGRLARLALLGRGPEALAAEIGGFLGRAVVVEGVRGDPIAVHAPIDDPVATAATAAYLADPRAVALRVPIGGPSGEPAPVGRLVLLGEGPADELERAVADRVAALLGLELARDSEVRQAREESGRSDALPAEGPPWVVMLARQGPAGGPPDAAGAGNPGGAADDLAGREAVRAQVRLLAGAGRLVLRGSAASVELRLVAAAPADDPGGLALADRIAAFLGRTVAVSRPFDEAGGRPAAEASARTTLEAAASVPEPPRVALATRLPAYQLLGNLHNLPDGVRQARDLLAPLLVGRPAAQRERLATLRAVLETSSLGEAAARLGVHRNTIGYRVARLEALGGWDLGDPDLRFILALAARLVQDAR